MPKTKSRIFQALRIEVNKELEALEISLRDAIELLEKD
ncbi:16S rRNA (cytosine(1402)-N(4))-methyltransferase [bacterium]|nr:16S rRNA (cytosine(1402)-N(4))-methyltransferase [bacterium]